MRSAPVVDRGGTAESEGSVEPTRAPGGLARRAGAFLVHEFREILPPTIFFLIGFNLIVLTTNLIIADYGAQFAGFMIATASALVVAKAVLVANAMPAIRRYDRAPLIQPILFKTAFYWVIVFFARLLERFVHFLFRRQCVGRFWTASHHGRAVGGASAHRGTEGSNPFPSSGQSVSLQISPSFLEKPGFSASMGTRPGRAVGRDARGPPTPR